jgi:hypothetical protein
LSFIGKEPAPMPGTSQQARIAALARFRPADDPELIEARRTFWADELADHIRQVVSEAPELTNEQLGRITAVLYGRKDGEP